MKNDLPLLQSTTLFSGLSAEELQALLTRLGAVERSFGRGEVLVLAGAPSRRVGVVLRSPQTLVPSSRGTTSFGSDGSPASWAWCFTPR